MEPRNDWNVRACFMCIRYHFLPLLHGYWIASLEAERRAEKLDSIDLHCLAAFTSIFQEYPEYHIMKAFGKSEGVPITGRCSPQFSLIPSSEALESFTSQYCVIRKHLLHRHFCSWSILWVSERPFTLRIMAFQFRWASRKVFFLASMVKKEEEKALCFFYYIVPWV